MEKFTPAQTAPLSAETFIREAKTGITVDVRSPAEFQKGHMPGAVNVPLFDDHERAEIGTLYKVKGKEEAVLRGIELVSPKLADFIKSVKEQAGNRKKVLVYCFRGGMRSSSFCWLMETAGLEVARLEGGYKAYRNLVLDSFKIPRPYLLLGGATGSSKTEVLNELKKLGTQVIDLEGLANHKGSAFGFIGMGKQPTQQQFENDLFFELAFTDPKKEIFLEDESFTIGSIRLPYDLWLQMKKSPIIKLEVPFILRVKKLVEGYGNTSIETLRKPLLAIQTRLGPQHCKTALEHLEKGELAEVAAITLKYYDEAYAHSHTKRSSNDIFPISTETDDQAANAQLIHTFARKKGLLTHG